VAFASELVNITDVIDLVILKTTPVSLIV